MPVFELVHWWDATERDGRFPWKPSMTTKILNVSCERRWSYNLNVCYCCWHLNNKLAQSLLDEALKAYRSIADDDFTPFNPIQFNLIPSGIWLEKKGFEELPFLSAECLIPFNPKRSYIDAAVPWHRLCHPHLDGFYVPSLSILLLCLVIKNNTDIPSHSWH